MSDMQIEQLVIIGSGPAGHAAAIYAARAELRPLMFEGFMAGGVAAGGQLTTTTDVENYPGFPKGIQGPELMQQMRAQSERFGTRIKTETVASVDLSRRPFRVRSDSMEVYAETLIVATGATAKRLDIPGARDGELWQRGVSACAVCDGALPIFRDRPLFVIGGGDSAMEESHFLAKYGSQVFVVHRRDELRASKIMQRRVLEHPKIEVLWSHVVEAAHGDPLLSELSLRDLKSGEVKKMPAAGLFFAIGHKPNTDFLDGQLELDETGYVITEPDSTRTSIPGVFAAGDVQDKVWRQAVTAAGTGCMAALEAERFLAALDA